MQNYDYENYTFESLGFEGVESIIKPTASKGNSFYDTIMIEHPKENITDSLTDEIIKYARNEGLESLEGFFYAGLAYMQDKSVVFVYNGFRYENKIMNVFLDPFYYQKAYKPDNKAIHSNIEYLAELVNSRRPDGLCILQEIPSPNPAMYHFRIVHDAPTDTVIPEENDRLDQIEKTIRRLMHFNRRSEFTAAEANEIENLIETLNKLDPEHEHTKLLKGFSIGEKKKGKLIQFPGKKR